MKPGGGFKQSGPSTWLWKSSLLSLTESLVGLYFNHIYLPLCYIQPLIFSFRRKYIRYHHQNQKTQDLNQLPHSNELTSLLMQGGCDSCTCSHTADLNTSNAPAFTLVFCSLNSLLCPHLVCWPFGLMHITFTLYIQKQTDKWGHTAFVPFLAIH